MVTRRPPSTPGAMALAVPPYNIPPHVKARLTMPPDGDVPFVKLVNGAQKVASPVVVSILYSPGTAAFPRAVWAPHNCPVASNAIPSMPSIVQLPPPLVG